MHLGRTTLSKFLIQQLQDIEGASDLGALLVDVAAAVKAIAAMTAKGALGGTGGEPRYGGCLGALAQRNVQAEMPKKLDVLAHEAMLRGCERGGLIAGMASQQRDHLCAVSGNCTRCRYLLVFDPLDGAPNNDVNASVGTIFSVLRHAQPEAPAVADFLQPGRAQVAAGYAIYGPATMLVLSVGKGTHGFTLDRAIGNFILTHPNLAIAEETSEVAIDSSNARSCEAPVHRYVTECQAGRSGQRGRDFDMRSVGSTVAEVHRVLLRGGVLMVPKDTRDATRCGRLRLLFEANPIALLVEQAGGCASTGHARLLDVAPASLHQRVPVILGSRREVERIERYHLEHDNGTDRPYVSPLFNERSLYRAEARV